MPFAQCGCAFREPGRLRGQLPGRLTSARARRDPRLVSTRCSRVGALLSAAPRTDVPLPRPDPGRRGSEDVQVAGRRGALDMLDTHGADAFRWYYFTSNAVGRGYRFSLETVGRIVAPGPPEPWNAYGFYVLYANVNDLEEVDLGDRPRPLGALAPRRHRERGPTRSRTTTPHSAGRAIAEFVDDSPTGTCAARAGAFWDGDPHLHHLARVPAGHRGSSSRRSTPSSPTRSTRPSTAPPFVRPVRLPEPGWRDVAPRGRMAVARRRRPAGARPAPTASSRCASRCARRSWWRRAASATRSGGWSPPAHRGAGQRESVRYVSEAASWDGFELSPDYRTLGRASAGTMPQVAAAVAGTRTRARRARVAPDNNNVGVSSTTERARLAPTTSPWCFQPLEGYQVERSGTHAVALNLTLDDGLLRQGLARAGGPTRPAPARGGAERGGSDLARPRRRRRAARGDPCARAVRGERRRWPPSVDLRWRRTAARRQIEGRYR